MPHRVNLSLCARCISIYTNFQKCERIGMLIIYLNLRIATKGYYSHAIWEKSKGVAIDDISRIFFKSTL